MKKLPLPRKVLAWNTDRKTAQMTYLIWVNKINDIPTSYTCIRFEDVENYENGKPFSTEFMKNIEELKN